MSCLGEIGVRFRELDVDRLKAEVRTLVASLGGHSQRMGLPLPVSGYPMP